MKLLLFILFFSGFYGFSQENDTLIYEVQDTEPEFPGGTTAFIGWIQESLFDITTSNGEAACLAHIFIEFVVEKDGSITQVKARNKCNSDLSHFTELLEKSPKWTPGTYKNKIVRSRVRIPITIEF